MGWWRWSIKGKVEIELFITRVFASFARGFFFTVSTLVYLIAYSNSLMKFWNLKVLKFEGMIRKFCSLKELRDKLAWMLALLKNESKVTNIFLEEYVSKVYRSLKFYIILDLWNLFLPNLNLNLSRSNFYERVISIMNRIFKFISRKEKKLQIKFWIDRFNF